MEIPQKIKVELPYDPAISLLGIFSLLYIFQIKILTQEDIKHPHVHYSSIYNSQNMEANSQDMEAT